MNCLDGQIGVIGLTSYGSAKSGLYINDLPGLTLNQLDKIKDGTEDAISVTSAWERIYKRAKKNFEIDVIGANRRHFRLTSIISSRLTGQISNTEITSSAVRSGIYFDFTDYSPNLEIFFNNALLYVADLGEITVEIYDANQGIKLSEYSQTQSTYEGLLNIPIQEGFSLFEYPKIFVCYQASLDVLKSESYAYSDFRHYNRSLPTASSVVYGNFSADDTGLILNYNMKCGVLSWICQNLDVFIKPFWYKLGVEFLNERFASDRFNRYTMINVEQAQELRSAFEKEYMQSLDDVLQTMHPTDDGYCFVCAKAMNQRIAMP
jgi:hypothetical protein